MTCFAFYETASKKLISLGTSSSNSRGDLSVKAFGANQPVGDWNTTTLDFDASPTTNVISSAVFLDRFTDTELEAIIALGRTNDKAYLFLEKLKVRPIGRAHV